MHSTLQPALPASAPYWNDTPAKTHFFEALSALMPAGEAFIVEAVEAAAATLAKDDPLREDARRLVEDEQSHQRAHRLYNSRLAEQGYPVAELERRAAANLAWFDGRLGVHQRLCLAAAFEHLACIVAKAALREGSGWLSAGNSAQARMWRWHCDEEIAHSHVTLDLMLACRVPGWQRLLFYVVASFAMAGDVVRDMQVFHRVDRARAQQQRQPGFWPGVLRFATGGMGLPRLAADWLGYFKPLRRLASPRRAAPAEPAAGPQPFPFPATARDIAARFLTAEDVPALLALEHAKWESDQAATAEDMAARIAAHPQLSVGAFDTATGEALASLFMKPTSRDLLLQSANWAECASMRPDKKTKELFGISFSSSSPEAGDALFEFFWPHALKAGWRHIYLGSPVPGFRKWLSKNPGGSVYRYVYSRCKKNKKKGRDAGMPRDPQLRYYRQRGFRKIVYIRPDYFPHEASQDYGVLIRGTVPLSLAAPLWQRLPLSWLAGLKKSLFVLL
jgi:predicted metal-dependent hydrolase